VRCNEGSSGVTIARVSSGLFVGTNGGGAGPEATGRGLSGVSRRGWCWTLDRLDGEGCSGRTNLPAADHERGVLVEGYLSIVTTLSQPFCQPELLSVSAGLRDGRDHDSRRHRLE